MRGRLPRNETAKRSKRNGTRIKRIDADLTNCIKMIVCCAANVRIRRKRSIRKNMLKTLCLIGFYVAILCAVSCAQTPPECSKFKYADFNKTQPEVQNVKMIAGTVRIDGSKDLRVSSCVSVYEEKTKKLVRVVYLQLKQKFELKDIPDGEYRLVVHEKDGFFCPVNIPVKVDQSIVEKPAITVELKHPSSDTCSYGDLKT
jgi:hypothetical protein